ncbi:HTH domain-containing protein [Flavobacterium sp. 102]|uniref:HTH domain-containing protein n=1 Tax=Flavobacterium sp. 102 TaxID=2135623 RepID=UPI000EB451BC|nr:HTH domain-containing protein [Flavobacterium sp. 102]RKS00582.1 HTH domain-containing protein [Flavobacterium sp. 102]
MDIRIIIKIHDLIKAKRAGNSEDLAERLGISVRTVYNYITFMKTELNAPIAYDSQNKKYNYERECELNFRG